MGETKIPSILFNMSSVIAKVDFMIVSILVDENVDTSAGYIMKQAFKAREYM